MCEPLSMTTLAIIGGSVGTLQAYATHEGQIAQHEAAVEGYLGNIDAASQAKIEADRQINLNQAQAEEKAAQEKIANALTNQRLTARARQASSATGAIQNNSAILQDMRRQGLMANNMISSNLQREAAQRNENRHMQRSNYQSRINQVARPEWDSSRAGLTSLMSGISTGVSTAAALGMMGAVAAPNTPVP